MDGDRYGSPGPGPDGDPQRSGAQHGRRRHAQETSQYAPQAAGQPTAGAGYTGQWYPGQAPAAQEPLPTQQYAGQPQYPGQPQYAGQPQHPGQPRYPGQEADLDPLPWAGDPGRGEPPRGGGPSGKVIAVTLGVTALVAVLVGGVYGLLRPAPPSAVTTSSPSAVASQDPAGQAEPAASGSAAPSSTAPSASPSRTARDVAYVEDPAAAGLDFGVLTGIDRSGGALKITLDRAQFLTGAKAAAYYEAHPDEEQLDFAIVNTNKRLRTFALAEDAAVWAQFALGDGSGPKTEQITADTFYEKTVGLLATDQTLLVWLKHTEGLDGPVYYVAEQYTP